MAQVQSSSTAVATQPMGRSIPMVISPSAIGSAMGKRRSRWETFCLILLLYAATSGGTLVT